MKSTLKVALAQLAIVDGDKEKNLEKIEQAIEIAYQLSADILVLPELMLTGLTDRDQMFQLAEQRMGASLKRIQNKLLTHPVSVVYSFPEKTNNNELFITTCMIRNDGNPIAYYRKTHLFTDEKKLFNLGCEWTIADIEPFKLGLLTCYDIEFPEPARTLALKEVNLLIVNSANMAPYEQIHRTFIKARAMENQIFVVYCNRIGKNSEYQYHGDSAVVGPDGKIIMEIARDREAIEVVELSLAQLEDSKAVFHYLADRRIDLYRE